MADIIDINVLVDKSFFNVPANYNKKVIYGIPKDSKVRKANSKSKSVKNSKKSKTDIQPQTSINNAEVLWLFEHGSAAKDIDGRPLLGPVRDNNIDIIQKKFFSKVFEALMQGDQVAADEYMQKLALFMERQCKAYFVSSNQNPKWKENTDSTIRAWAKDVMKKNKSVTADEAVEKTVGIWTGQMRSALRGLVVEDKD